tara:strand:+ start:3478 stop:4332 length:855 start_codon:yes stop_codon:yes gene_type:complete
METDDSGVLNELVAGAEEGAETQPEPAGNQGGEQPTPPDGEAGAAGESSEGEKKLFDPKEVVPVHRYNETHGRMRRAERLVDQLTRDRGRTEEQPPPSRETAEKPPTRDSFEEEDDYLRAVARHEGRQAYLSEKAKDQQLSEQETGAQQETEFHTRLMKGSGKFQDFDEAREAASFIIPPELNPYLMACDNPADVIHFLGTHPDKATEIVRSRTLQAAGLAIGRLDATFTDRNEPPPTRETNITDPPPKPVGGHEPPERNWQDMTTKEIYEKYNKEHGIAVHYE